jgi:hypothetical protein
MRKAKVGIGKVAFAVFSALLCADAHAAEHNWTLIKKKLYGKSPMKVDIYVDAESVKRKGDTVWLDSLKDIKLPDGKILSKVHHYELSAEPINSDTAPKYITTSACLAAHPPSDSL